MMNSLKWRWGRGAWIFLFFNMVGFWVWIKGQWVLIYFCSNWWAFGFFSMPPKKMELCG
jgi:hypothetical protein